MTRRKVSVDSGQEAGVFHDSDSADAKKKSVFERLGKPGPSFERSSSVKEKTEKCRKWQMFGNCPYGRDCKYLHADTGGSSTAGSSSTTKYRNDDVDDEEKHSKSKSKQKQTDVFDGESSFPPSKKVPSDLDSEKRALKKEKKKAKLEPIVLHSKVQRPDTKIDVFKEQKQRDVRKIEVKQDLKSDKRSKDEANAELEAKPSEQTPERVDNEIEHAPAKKQKKKRKDTLKEKLMQLADEDGIVSQIKAARRESRDAGKEGGSLLPAERHSKSRPTEKEGRQLASDSKRSASVHKKKKKKSQRDNSRDASPASSMRRDDRQPAKTKPTAVISPSNDDRSSSRSRHRTRDVYSDEEQDELRDKETHKKGKKPDKDHGKQEERPPSAHARRKELPPSRHAERRHRSMSESPSEVYNSGGDSPTGGRSHRSGDARVSHHGSNRHATPPERHDRRPHDHYSSRKDSIERERKPPADHQRHQQRQRFSPGPSYKESEPWSHEQPAQHNRNDDRGHGGHAGGGTGQTMLPRGRGRGGHRPFNRVGGRTDDHHSNNLYGRKPQYHGDKPWLGRGGRDSRSSHPNDRRFHGDGYAPGHHDNNPRDYANQPYGESRRDNSGPRDDSGKSQRHNQHDVPKKEGYHGNSDLSRSSPQPGKRRRETSSRVGSDSGDEDRASHSKRRKVQRRDDVQDGAQGESRRNSGTPCSTDTRDQETAKGRREKEAGGGGRERPTRGEHPAGVKSTRDRDSSHGRKRSREPTTSSQEASRKEEHDASRGNKRKRHSESCASVDRGSAEQGDQGQSTRNVTAEESDGAMTHGGDPGVAGGSGNANDVYDNFSDSSIGDGTATPTAGEKPKGQGEASNQKGAKQKTSNQDDPADIDDVYESISDEDIALWEQEDFDGKVNRPAAVGDVDWSLLASLTPPEKNEGENAVDYRAKLSSASILRSVGFSPALLSSSTLSAARRAFDDVPCASGVSCSALGINDNPDCHVMGAVVACGTRRMGERKRLYTTMASLSGSFGLRRDLACRRELRKRPTKFGTRTSLFCSAPAAAVDRDILNASLVLYRKQHGEDKTSKASFIASRVGVVVAC